MPRKTRLATISFANVPGGSVEANRRSACELVEQAAPKGTDLICLPEEFLMHRVSPATDRHVESVDGPTFDAMSELAQRFETWIVVCLLIRDADGDIRNTAVAIDRQGRLVGTYAKMHPTIVECEDRNIVPGEDINTIDTDFGRVGIAICFDIGWPELWATLQTRGAELVVWPSAYDGGFPLQAYAWTHSYYVVSSVRTSHSRVIDLTGRILASTGGDDSVAVATIDLEKEVFHTDGHAETLLRLERELGAGITVDRLPEEHIFTVESNEIDWPLERIKAVYSLEDFRTYHERSKAVQDRRRSALSM